MATTPRPPPCPPLRARSRLTGRCARSHDLAEKSAAWFGFSECEVDWVRTAEAGEDDQVFSGALLGIDEAGWLPMRMRASPFDTDGLDGVVEE